MEGIQGDLGVSLSCPPAESLATQFGKREKSVARVQKLVNRLKRFSAADLDALLREINALDVSMHLSEVSTSLYETPLKVKDIPAFTQICSQLHLYYGSEFSTVLTAASIKAFEASTDLSRRRIIPCLYIELVMAGVFEDLKPLSRILQSLCEMPPVQDDQAHPLQFQNVAILETLCRRYGNAVFGRENIPATSDLSQDTAVSVKSSSQDTPLPPGFQDSAFRLLKTHYLANAETILAAAQSLIDQQSIANQQKRIMKGHIDVESELKHKAIVLTAERVRKQLDTIAKFLGESALVPSAEREGGEEVTRLQPHQISAHPVDDIPFADIHHDSDQHWWTSERERLFYCTRIDLSHLAPSSVLVASHPADPPKPAAGSLCEPRDSEPPLPEVEGKSMKGTSPVAAKSDAAVRSTDSPVSRAAPPSPSAKPIAKPNPTEDKKRPGLQPSQFFDLLSKAKSVSDIEDAAVQFFLSELHLGKSVRKKLIRLFLTSHWNDLYILPFLAKFLDTVAPYTRELVQAVTEGALADYKRLAETKNMMKIESHIKAARFVGELCKFQLVPTGVLVDFLSELLEDYNLYQIQVACHLLQSCGRFLYFYEGLKDRFKNKVLIRMQNVKTMRNVPDYIEVLIEDTFELITCSHTDTKAHPLINPERPLRALLEASPVAVFLQYLLQDRLHHPESTLSDVLRSLKRMNWAEEPLIEQTIKAEVYATIYVSTTSYLNIENLASLLCGLAPRHSQFIVQLIDLIMECFQIELEDNNHRQAPSRIRCVKFIAELFNHRLIDTTVLLDVLYHLIGFGSCTSFQCSSLQTLRALTKDGLALKPNTPIAHPAAPPDSPTDYFRIRLICILLQTSGQYFVKGSAKEKLDRFLLCFQRYLLFKRQVPLNLRFLVEDSFATLRPKLAVEKTCAEIDQELSSIILKSLDTDGREENDKLTALEDQDGLDDETSENQDDDDKDVNRVDEDDFFASCNSEPDTDDLRDKSGSDEDSDGHTTSSTSGQGQAYLEDLQRAEFDREFEEMVAESLQSAKSESKYIKGRQGALDALRVVSSANKAVDKEQETPDSVRLRLIMRKGKDKLRVKAVAVPKSCRLVQALYRANSAETEDHAKLKEFVLESVTQSRKQELIETQAQLRDFLFTNDRPKRHGLDNGLEDRRAERQDNHTGFPERRAVKVTRGFFPNSFGWS